MAYEATTYYCWSGTTDGTNNKLLMDSNPGATTNTTVTPTVSTSGGGDYLMRPITNGIKQAYTTTGQNFGWNHSAANSDVTGTRRRVAAGTWQFSAGIGINSGLGYPAGTTVPAKVNVYARAVSTGALRYIGTLTGTASPQSLSVQTFTCTASLSEVILEVGECIHVELWLTLPNASVTNYVIAVTTGTGYWVILPGAGLRYRYDRAYAATSSSSASIAKKVNLAAKAATSSATAAFNRRLTLFVSKLASSTATATYDRRLTLFRSLAASSTAQATRQGFRILLRPLAASSTAQALRGPFVITLRALKGTSTATATAAKLLFKNLAATSSTAATYARQLQFKRSLSASASAIASMFVLLPQSVLNRMAGGAVTVIKRITYIFDD